MEQRFQMPQSSSWWKRRMVSFLRNKLRFPGILLYGIQLTSGNEDYMQMRWFTCRINFGRFPVDSDFLYQSEGMGLHIPMVYVGTCSSQMGFRSLICKFTFAIDSIGIYVKCLFMLNFQENILLHVLGGFQQIVLSIIDVGKIT